jgi:hypothetical protein
VEHALSSARRNREEVSVALAIDNGHVRVTLGPRPPAVRATVLVVGFDRRHITDVKRGENAGRALAHIDVVRSLEEIAQSDAQESVVEAPVGGGFDRIAAILQAEDGRILGVAVRDAN